MQKTRNVSPNGLFFLDVGFPCLSCICFICVSCNSWSVRPKPFFWSTTNCKRPFRGNENTVYLLSSVALLFLLYQMESKLCLALIFL